MFRNDLFLCIKKSDFHNFVDDSAITARCDTLTEPLETFGLNQLGLNKTN